MNRQIIITMDVAHSNVATLRREARMSRGHDGVATMDRFRSITRRRTR